MDSSSKANFQQRFATLPSLYNTSGVPIQRGAIPMTVSCSGGGIATGSTTTANIMMSVLNPAVSACNRSLIIPTGSSSAKNTIVDAVPSLKQDNNQVIDWSWEEQVLLKQGLIRHANEPNIMKYVKIAAMLEEKSVRDVALRCQWLKKREQFKRRKPDESYAGKRIKDRKEKMIDRSSLTKPTNALSGNFPAYPSLTHNVVQNNKYPYEASDGGTLNLLEENAQILMKVNTNITSWKMQDNIDLLVRARNNITSILNSMCEMPGMMGRMPPLPVKVDDDLVHTMLHNASQAIPFGKLPSTTTSIYLHQASTTLQSPLH